VGPGDGLDDSEKRKCSFFFREPGIVQPVAYSLYRLSEKMLAEVVVA
jgi:hypothetical protein